MKVKIFTLIALLCGLFLSAAEDPGTFRAQLEDLNKFWIGRQVDHLQLSKRKVVTGEVQLIQSHLSLVEDELRRADTKHLSLQQQSNRLRCLDILHAYWTAGLFPRNLYHKERTPYFIDDVGTACAVGQLIISTGFETLARRISRENNYGYLKELNRIYPEISQWANEFGFELEELAWIQPCYCNYVEAKTVNVSCHGGHDGYFRPDLNQIQGVHDVKFYVSMNNNWQEVFPMCGFCNLSVGKYRITAKDASAKLYTFDADITQPSPPVITHVVKGNPSSCNASATVVVSNSSAALTYFWAHDGSTNKAATGLCQQIYTVTVTENQECFHYELLDLNTVTSISEKAISRLELFPNPVKNSLTLTNELPSEGVTINVYNALGVLCLTAKAESDQPVINTAELPSGVYIIKSLTSNGRTLSGRFVKE